VTPVSALRKNSSALKLGLQGSDPLKAGSAVLNGHARTDGYLRRSFKLICNHLPVTPNVNC